MTAYMPTVEMDKLNNEQREIMLSLTENGRLVPCPSYDCNLQSKLVHNELLRLLYRDSRWTVPLHWAWYMPHICEPLSKDDWIEATVMAESIIASDCFGSPQPVCIGHKLYRVYREDGSTFEMEVA